MAYIKKFEIGDLVMLSREFWPASHERSSDIGIVCAAPDRSGYENQVRKWGGIWVMWIKTGDKKWVYPRDITKVEA